MADEELKAQTWRLHRLGVYGRWALVLFSWLVIVPLSLWNLREEIYLLRTYFTWTGLRYAIVYNFWPSLGLTYCLAITTSSLVWQSKNIIWGISPREKQRLENQIRQIQLKGPRHPLWRWVIQK